MMSAAVCGRKRSRRLLWHGLYVGKHQHAEWDVIPESETGFLHSWTVFQVEGSYNSDYTVTKSRSSSVATYNPILQSDGTIAYRKTAMTLNWDMPKDSAKAETGISEASLNYARSFGLHHVGALLLYNQSKVLSLTIFGYSYGICRIGGTCDLRLEQPLYGRVQCRIQWFREFRPG